MRYRITLAWHRLLIAAASAGIAAAIVSVQPLASQDQQSTFKARANFVRVDVYPTRDGKPVDDLRAEDFEVSEDGTAQAVTSFEHVVVQAPTPGAPRVEPGTVSQSRQAAAGLRSRVFVLFLDLPHVSFEASRDSAGPLIGLLDRLLAPDDLIGIMTPDMAPSDLVLARKTDVIQSSLGERLAWGQRSRRTERERVYERCYAVLAPERVDEMAARAQERATLEALSHLVEYLDTSGTKEGDLTVSEGWLLSTDRALDAQARRLAGRRGQGSRPRSDYSRSGWQAHDHG